MSMPPAEVRPPWPDEIPRVQYFLPTAFLFDPDPFLLVAVSGHVERFVGAMAMAARPLEGIKTTWLCMRVEDHHERTAAEMLRRGLDEAWARGVQSVYFGETVDEKSERATALKEMGFEPAATHEVMRSVPQKSGRAPIAFSSVYALAT